LQGKVKLPVDKFLFELSKIEKDYKVNGPSMFLYEKAIQLKMKQPYLSLWETNLKKYKG
jgi:hypothetical protein